jgi:hypothetical protein
VTTTKPQKLLIGKIKCTCGEIIPVHENTATKTLSYPCGWCGAPSYARADGSNHYQTTLARVIRSEPPKEVPIEPPPAPVKTGLFTTS